MRNGLIRTLALYVCIVLLFISITGCSRDNAKPASDIALQQDCTTESTSSESQPVNENGTETMDFDEEIGEGEELTTPIPEQTEPDIVIGTETENPNLTEPNETQPKHTEPVPTTPKPTEPEPTHPIPTEPETTQPPVTAPPSTEPVATDPPETDPPITEPEEVIDLDALVQYGLNYAADTYGYRIYPGVRDGYYPAYTCIITTMAEGRAAVKGCIDDTTRALLARPGMQIITEIDGVICRARIDITIVPKDKGTYLVSVFYG